MASSNPHRRRNSKDIPPDLLSDVIRLRAEFIALYDRHYHELLECTQALRRLVNTFEGDLRSHIEAARDVGVMGIAGGVIAIAGLALAPFTMGTSAVVSVVGTGLAAGGGISSGVINFMKMNQQKKLVINIKNGLKEFQNKIVPMADILQVFCKNINEILRDLNKPEGDIGGFMKCAAGASEILRIIRIDDIGEVAAQLSKTVRLTGTLTGVFTGIGLVFDILSVIEDNKALDDMDKLAGNRQISESEMKSKAGKFIVEMRKVIDQLLNILNEFKKTKDNIARALV